MNRSLLLILNVAALFSIIGCDASPFRMYSARTDAHFEKAKNDIHEAANSTAEALSSVRVDYVNESQAKLNALDKQYVAIKERLRFKYRRWVEKGSGEYKANTRKALPHCGGHVAPLFKW